MKEEEVKIYVKAFGIILLIIGISSKRASYLLPLGIVILYFNSKITSYICKKNNQIINEEDSKENEPETKPQSNNEEQIQTKTQIEVKETNENDKIPQIKPEYKRPPLALLDIPKSQANSTEVIANNSKTLELTLESFNIKAKTVEVHVGPSQTQYEMEIESGVKLDKIANLQKEISFALGSDDLEMQLPIPGKRTIGITIENKEVIKVSLRDLIKNQKEKDRIMLPLGRDIHGDYYIDLFDENSFMITGTVGTGKSMLLHSMLISIYYNMSPDEIKFLILDPKKAEFSYYESSPFLLAPIITNSKKCVYMLDLIEKEINDRCELFKKYGAKNIQAYNKKVEELNKNNGETFEKIPYILIIIDELSELLFVAKDSLPFTLNSILNKSRYAGVYIIATTNQSYSFDKDIMDILPAKICFNMTESMYSTKIGMPILNKSLGQGEIIYKPIGSGIKRIQIPYITDEEIKRVNDYVKSNDIKFNIIKNAIKDDSENKDVLYDEILNYAIRMGQISASLIQRKYEIGYNRAARIMDQFEEKGIVGPAKGSKPREVLIKKEDINE